MVSKISYLFFIIFPGSPFLALSLDSTSIRLSKFIGVKIFQALLRAETVVKSSKIAVEGSYIADFQPTSAHKLRSFIH